MNSNQETKNFAVVALLVALTSISGMDRAKGQDELAGQSTAAGPTTSKTGANPLNSFSIAAGYSFADQISAKSAGSSDIETYKAEGAPSLSARYGLEVAKNLSVLMGGTFEFSRKIKSVSVAGSTSDTGDSKPAYSALLIEPNLAYSLTQQIFAFGGANYPVIFKSGDWGNTSIRGDLGAQVGVGYVPVDRVSVELLYRTMNMTLQNGDQKSDYARSWGPQLRMSYSL